MPLSRPGAREPIHTRAIECTSYQREDGLWDVEGHLTDVVSFDFPNEFRGIITAGTPVHDMWLRLTVDADIVVRDVEAAIDAAPYEICPAIAPAFGRLKGLRIGPGWNRKAREQVGGVLGCTHLVELLRPVATVAFKTVRRARNESTAVGKAGTDDSPSQINSCHALASDSYVVQERWPDHYTGS